MKDTKRIKVETGWEDIMKETVLPGELFDPWEDESTEVDRIIPPCPSCGESPGLEYRAGGWRVAHCALASYARECGDALLGWARIAS